MFYSLFMYITSEHWIHSHPDVCPCDVYPGPFVWNYKNIPSNSNWKVELAQAPRFSSIQNYLPNDESGKYVRDNAMCIKEGSWYHLSGRLHEWRSLYNAVPRNDSWVWSYYKKDPHFGKLEWNISLGKLLRWCLNVILTCSHLNINLYQYLGHWIIILLSVLTLQHTAHIGFTWMFFVSFCCLIMKWLQKCACYLPACKSICSIH